MSKNLRPSAEDLLSKPFPWAAREDRVIIYPDEPPKLTETGLIIPEVAIGKPTSGIVVEVGPGLPNKPTDDIKVGDHVLYGRYAGTEIDVNDTLYIVVRQSDIMLRHRSETPAE